MPDEIEDSLAKQSMLLSMDLTNLFATVGAPENVAIAACLFLAACGIALGRTDRERVMALLDAFTKYVADGAAAVSPSDINDLINKPTQGNA